uniref:Protein MAIN-LIKE 1-like n=1 Tax=Cicer arietinum TaxID=3827 RepID=A0A1S2YU66_CICAR|nr:protein MAIN-LIKE 1-like [Cicer arietinum]
MVRTMFTDREGRVILNEGTSNAESNADDHRIRPTASARAQRRRVQRQQEESQPEPQTADIDEPPQDVGYPGGPVDSSVLRTFGDHVATRLWDGERQQEESQPEPQTADIDEPPQDVGYPGGPVDSSVLRTFCDHVATRLWDDRGELRVFSNGKKLKEVVIEDEEIEQLVKSSGLYSLLKCSYEMIDKWIISAFVERWHRDTSSFHLPIGEMTITLDDVSSLLHIPITGAFFSVNVFNKDEGADILAELLGVSHGVAYVEFNVTRTTTVRYSWLLDVYHQRCREQRW